MIPQLEREPAVSAPTETQRWSLPTRIGFRFVFSYFFLYAISGAVGSLGSYKKFKTVDAALWDKIWHPIVPWVGAHVLGITGDFSEVPNGSGDQLYDYVLVFCLIATALLITAIWSWADRKRPNYSHAYLWLRVCMRLMVGWAMLGYGVKKLIGAQFTPLTLARQVQPFDRATPMGMLWTFMGASQPYSFFGGFGETLGGVLIVIPPLATLGTLVSLVMMANVLMLNLCYDVPRKIFSIHLVLMCLFLLLPEFRRLTNVFILNRQADPVPRPPLFKDKFMNWVAVTFQVAFGAYVLFIAGAQSIRDLRGEVAMVSPEIRGVWFVDELVVGGIPHLPLVTDSDRWQNVIFDNPSHLTFQLMNGREVFYALQLASDGNSLTLTSGDNPPVTGTFAINRSGADRMTLEGNFGIQQITAHLKRVNLSDPKDYPLVNLGFHWVDPSVYNPSP